MLQHDLFPQTVDLATGYTLQAAMTNNPPLTVSHYNHLCLRRVIED